jgi:hypothetical protein
VERSFVLELLFLFFSREKKKRKEICLYRLLNGLIWYVVFSDTGWESSKMICN